MGEKKMASGWDILRLSCLRDVQREMPRGTFNLGLTVAVNEIQVGAS